jgi:polyhydroxybutyrate depolymerase
MLSTHRTRSKRAAALVVVFVALAAACGGPDESDDAAPSTDLDRPTTSATTSTPARASAGCGQEPPATAVEPSGDTPLTFDGLGTSRTYRLGVPDSYDPDEPTPLILNLHGANSNAAEQSAYSQLPAHGIERGYLVVTPDAVDERWELAGAGDDDNFLTGLLDDVAQDYCVDLDQVHAAGISLGAWKATVTACTHPDRFASLALVAEEVAPPDCALPVVAFHGTADRVVPYGDGADDGVVVVGPNAGLSGVEVNMANWARNAGCSEVRDVERIEPDVERWTFRDCRDGFGVELYSIRGGGHTWPGSPVGLPGTTTTIDATAIALDWFDAHPGPR